jgi:D-alanine transaminase
MERIFFNGEFREDDIVRKIIRDRALLFGDSVYEVIKFEKGKLILFEDHMERMEEGLKFLKIKNPLDRKEWKRVCMELVYRFGKDRCKVYIQITRGSRKRVHEYDFRHTPNYFAFVQELDKEEGPFDVIVYPEIRWKKVNIKTTNLLANVMAKTMAKEKGCNEAIFCDINGYVYEGATTNLFIVKDEIFLTPPLKNVLPGVTRKRLIEFLGKKEFKVVEKNIFLWDLFNSDGVFLTGTSFEIGYVRRINNIKIPFYKNFEKLRDKFRKYVFKIS